MSQSTETAPEYAVTARLGGYGPQVALPVHPDNTSALYIYTDRYWTRRTDFMARVLIPVLHNWADDGVTYAGVDWGAVRNHLSRWDPMEREDKMAVLRAAYEMETYGLVGPDHILALSASDRARVETFVEDLSKDPFIRMHAMTRVAGGSSRVDAFRSASEAFM